MLIDSERSDADADPKPRIRQFAETCEASGLRCHVLERRAIENYFLNDAVHQGVGEQYEALTPYARLGDEGHSWSKRDNWRIAAETTDEDLDGTDLGDFLESLIEHVDD